MPLMSLADTISLKFAKYVSDTSSMTVNPSQVDMLSRLLDAAALRQRVLGQNVANVNTPGYHRQDVAFEEELANELKRHHQVDAHKIQLTVHEPTGLKERADGNNVDIDQEMGQLAKNTLLYRTYTDLLGSKIRMLRSAITGR